MHRTITFPLLFLLCIGLLVILPGEPVQSLTNNDKPADGAEAAPATDVIDWFYPPDNPAVEETEETEEPDEEAAETPETAEKPEKTEPASPTLRSVYPLPPSSIYTYTQMVTDLQSLQAAYPDLIKLGNVGYSVEGRPLWSATLGKGAKKVLIVGTCHAREWLNTPLLVRTIEIMAKQYAGQASVDGIPVRPVLDQYTIVFVPMQNPDGVILSQFGLASFAPEKHEQLLAMKPVRDDNFTVWKANVRGVDLNRQHSAGPGGWTAVKNLNPTNPGKPWFENYVGPHQESEPESRAIADLINRNNFELVLTYHASGELFYWYYFQDEFSITNYNRDLKIVNAMAAYSGYYVYPREYLHNRIRNFGAHLTAWVVHDKKVPCITVEIGKFTTGYLKMGDLQGIWLKTRALPLVAIKNLPGYRTTFNITGQAVPAEGGTVSGGGTFPYGSPVTVAAAAAPHFIFTGWLVGDTTVSTDPQYNFTVTGDRALKAQFVPEKYKITAGASPEEGGSVEGGGDYSYAAGITLKALPKEGYAFVQWTENGAAVSSNEVYSFTVQKNRNLIAEFIPLTPPDNGGDEN
jgi:murein tripeptide amidase MpaA